MNPPNSTDWVPLAFDANPGGEPFLDWVYIGDTRFVEPFWGQTVEKCLNLPFAAAFVPRTTLVEADAMAQSDTVLPPLGFIFHVSRCGSTLVSRLLSTLPQVRVLSEASPFDATLRLREHRPDISDDEHIAVLQSVWRAMARKRFADETGVVVKWDAWHTAFVPLLRRAFPGVPMVFVYRDPLEVMASHGRTPGLQMVPGLLPPALFGMTQADVHDVLFTIYQVRVLASFFAAGIAHFTPDECIAYDMLPDAIWEQILPRFQIVCSPEQRKRLQEQATFSAKNPSFFFESDSAAKQAEARDRFSALVTEYVRPLYETLESRRSVPVSQSAASENVSAI